MRYFFAFLALATAVLITLKPELATGIIAIALAVAGLLLLLPNE
jgi:hypothetical protein